jgi:hypothetical protein
VSKALGAYSTRGGFRIDGTVTKFWATKQQAKDAARSIGWPVKSVQPVHTRFQNGWGLGWGVRTGLVTHEEWSDLQRRDTF